MMSKFRVHLWLGHSDVWFTSNSWHIFIWNRINSFDLAKKMILILLLLWNKRQSANLCQEFADISSHHYSCSFFFGFGPKWIVFPRPAWSPALGEQTSWPEPSSPFLCRSLSGPAGGAAPPPHYGRRWAPRGCTRCPLCWSAGAYLSRGFKPVKRQSISSSLTFLVSVVLT